MKHGSLRRVYELDRMIRFGRLVSARQAAEHFEVSVRTIQRDLEELRYDLGAELVYNRGRRCYEYKGNPITLPAQWLTEREIAILLISERALRIFTNTSFQEEIHPAFNKLLDPIRHDRKMLEYIHDLCNSVHFHRPVESLRDVRGEFSIVLDAVMQRKRLSMVYHTAGRQRRERREIEPYALINNGGEWYVVGNCRRAREERTFVLSQIREPKIEDHYFAIPDEFDVEQYLDQGFGRMRGEKAARVRLEIRPPASAWVGRSRWHHTQRIRRARNGAVSLSMRCPLTDTLVRWVLQMGECVKILKPDELRVLVVEKARAIVGNN